MTCSCLLLGWVAILRIQLELAMLIRRSAKPSRDDRRVSKEKTGVPYEHLANNGQAESVSPQGTFPDRSISKSVDSAEGDGIVCALTSRFWRAEGGAP